MMGPKERGHEEYHNGAIVKMGPKKRGHEEYLKGGRISHDGP